MRRLLATGLTVLLLAALMPATPAAAYNLFGCQFGGGGNNLKWQDSTTRASYSNPAHTAVTAWNSTSTQLQMTQVTSGANIRVSDRNFGASWMGGPFSGITLTAAGDDDPLAHCGSDHLWDVGLTVWWNRYYTDAYPEARRQAIIVHELGHALGLDHTTGDGCIPSIMDVDLDVKFPRCGRTTPKQDDINGINVMY